MAAAPYNPTGEYQPKSTIGLPPLYAWPPRFVAGAERSPAQVAPTNDLSFINV